MVIRSPDLLGQVT